MQVSVRTLLVCISLCWSFSVNSAAEDSVPRIKVDELKKMMDDGVLLTILDTQPLDVYEEGHIQGAISFPWKREITPQDVRDLPKNKMLVTYCDCGPGESDSSDVASQLLNLGFQDVRVLQDPSIRQWEKAGYPMQKK